MSSNHKVNLKKVREDPIEIAEKNESISQTRELINKSKTWLFKTISKLAYGDYKNRNKIQNLGDAVKVLEGIL